jgi:hypothetical protein
MMSGVFGPVELSCTPAALSFVGMAGIAADVAARVLEFAAPVELERLQREVAVHTEGSAHWYARATVYRQVLERVLYAAGAPFLMTLHLRPPEYERYTHAHLLHRITDDLRKLYEADALDFQRLGQAYNVREAAAEYTHAFQTVLDVDMGTDSDAEDVPMADE